MQQGPCSTSYSTHWPIFGVAPPHATPRRSSAWRRMARHTPTAAAAASPTPASAPSSSSSPPPTPPPDPVFSIRARDLTVRLGQAQQEVLRGVQLQVRRGSLHMLLGPNGCGKSTLLRVLGGLIPEYSGQIQMDGPSGFVFQNPDHQVVMPTVAADVAFGLGRYVMREEDVQAAVSSALRLVNMQDHMFRATHTLSGGQRQRVAIAGSLAENPKLLLLDELTTFLDVEDQFGVLDAVRNITRLKGDVTALWVTHRFEELESADAASYMQDGRIVFTGSPVEMRAFLKSTGAPT